MGVCIMDSYKLDEDLNQKVVEGLVDGYREYLEIRKEKAQTMLVSGAYAWVKANHIDDKVARACSSLGVEHKLAKAGLAWQYLKFNHLSEKFMFIIKNAKYFNEEKVSKGTDILGNTRKGNISYMEKLMEINSNIDFESVETEALTFAQQLSLFEEKKLSESDNEAISSVGKDFDRFYIITYSLDENQMISKISLFMPNPSDNKAYLIDDLTDYMNSLPAIEIGTELKEILVQNIEDDDNYSAINFDIAINTTQDEVKGN